MLQQTQVARVIGPFLAFMDRWPDPAALARSRPGEVIGAWQGLGYNRRAVRLHACSQAIVEHHGGRVSDDMRSLLDLPGIGSYAARAVLAFAFERPVGILDTNAARVLARAFAGRRLAAREAQVLADSVVPAGRAWMWNSAMLDLGATICTARQPACGRCPLANRACVVGMAAGNGTRTRRRGRPGRRARRAGSKARTARDGAAWWLP